MEVLMALMFFLIVGTLLAYIIYQERGLEGLIIGIIILFFAVIMLAILKKIFNKNKRRKK